jgi:hypothetical protein
VSIFSPEHRLEMARKAKARATRELAAAEVRAGVRAEDESAPCEECQHERAEHPKDGACEHDGCDCGGYVSDPQPADSRRAGGDEDPDEDEPPPAAARRRRAGEGSEDEETRAMVARVAASTGRSPTAVRASLRAVSPAWCKTPATPRAAVARGVTDEDRAIAQRHGFKPEDVAASRLALFSRAPKETRR